MLFIDLFYALQFFSQGIFDQTTQKCSHMMRLMLAIALDDSQA